MRDLQSGVAHNMRPFMVIMKRAIALLLVAAAALACRGRSAPAQRTQQQYDVVQEGQTTSATSTIDAPGEVRPPIATATNTDTTGSFTLPTTAAPPNMPGGPAGGVLPPQQPGAMSSGMRMPAPRQPAPIVITTQPRPVERRPPPTDTTDTAPPTDTAATDTTQTTTTPPTQTDTIGGH
jgi:hypothetical protein